MLIIFLLPNHSYNVVSKYNVLLLKQSVHFKNNLYR